MCGHLSKILSLRPITLLQSYLTEHKNHKTLHSFNTKYIFREISGIFHLIYFYFRNIFILINNLLYAVTFFLANVTYSLSLKI